MDKIVIQLPLWAVILSVIFLLASWGVSIFILSKGKQPKQDQNDYDNYIGI